MATTDVNLTTAQVSEDVLTKATNLSTIATNAITSVKDSLRDLSSDSMSYMTLWPIKPTFHVNKNLSIGATLPGTLPNLNVNLPSDIGDPTIPAFIDTLPSDDLDAIYSGIAKSMAAFNQAVSTLPVYDATRIDKIKKSLAVLIDMNTVFGRMTTRNSTIVTGIDGKTTSLTLLGCPPLAAINLRADVVNRSTYASTDTTREADVKSSDLNYEDSKFIRSTTVNIESLIMANYNYMAQRALEAAGHSIRLSVEIFKVAIAKYEARADIYKTDAGVFIARKRAQLIAVEIFRTRVEAYVAKIQGLSGQYSALVGKYSANILIQKLNNEVQKELQGITIKQAESNLDIQLKLAEASLNAIIKTSGMKVNNLVGAADVMASQAHSAINALDTTVQQVAQLIALEHE